MTDVLHSSGQPFDSRTRAFLEPRFGHDFSRVRIHTDAAASSSARAINALAYTVSPHIVFATGSYRPNDRDGQELLAHELAHIVQQDVSGYEAAQPKLRIDESEAAERAAEHIGHEFSRGHVVSASASTPSGGRSTEVGRVQRLTAQPFINKPTVADDPTAKEASRQIEAIRDVTVKRGLDPNLRVRLIMNELAEADAALKAYRGTINSSSTVLLPVLGYANVGPPPSVVSPPSTTTTTLLGPGAVIGVGVTVIIGLSNWIGNSLTHRTVSNAEAARRLAEALKRLAETAKQIPRQLLAPQASPQTQAQPQAQPQPQPPSSPQTQSQTSTNNKQGCVITRVPALGGDHLANMFCGQVTHTADTYEWSIVTPSGEDTTFDSRFGNVFYECKCGYLSTTRAYRRFEKTGEARDRWAYEKMHGQKHEAAYGSRPERLASGQKEPRKGLIEEIRRHLRILDECSAADSQKYKYRIVVSNDEFASLLRELLGTAVDVDVAKSDICD